MAANLSESQRISQIQQPIIPSIAKLIHANPGTVNFGQGIVHYPPPAEVKEAINEFFRNPLNHRYKAVDGLPQLKEAIYEKLANENQIDINQPWTLFVTAGSNMGFLQAILTITDPGDEVIQLSPYYFNHEMAIRMASALPVFVETDNNYQPDIEKISSAITNKTKAIVTISPNNPTAAVYPRETLMAINQLCAQHGLYHINDEAYEYFTYDQTRHYSPASHPKANDHTISLFSLSKTYGMASWRIGYMLAPLHLETALGKVQDTNLICAPVISQMAASAALKTGRHYCTPQIDKLKQSRQNIYTALSEASNLFTFTRPEGAFYFYIKANTPLSSMELARFLIEKHKVAVIPGETFGETKTCSFRLAYGALNQIEISEGINRIISGVNQAVRKY